MRDAKNCIFALSEMHSKAKSLGYADYSGQSPNPQLSTIYLECRLFNFFNSLVKHGPNFAMSQELSQFQEQVSSLAA
jgi:hypothetical protein